MFNNVLADSPHWSIPKHQYPVIYIFAVLNLLSVACIFTCANKIQNGLLIEINAQKLIIKYDMHVYSQEHSKN